MNISQRIKNLRVSMKLKQIELAQKIGVGKTTISNWETGYSSPDNDSLIKLSEILDCTVDYLLGISEDKQNIVIKPIELNGYSEVIEIAKNAGLSSQDIREIIETCIKIKGK